MIEAFMKKQLRSFQNYQVIKILQKYVINANESPYNLFHLTELQEELAEIIENYKPNRYPDGAATRLRDMLAMYTGYEADRILVGNGADEIIVYLAQCFLDPGDAVITHTPSFEMYGISCTIAGADVHHVPDLADYRIDIDGMIAKAKELEPKLIFLCSPNNPTGYMPPRSEIVRLIEETKALIVLDEAYVEFADRDDLDLLDHYDRLIVLRTLSKAFGIAGLRVGYAVSSLEIITALNKVKGPYNVSSFSQEIAVLALEHKERIFEALTVIKSERERMKEALRQMPGMKVYDAQSNFLLVHTEDSERIFEELLDNSILCKYYGDRPHLEHSFRITIATKEINDKVLACFEKGATHG